MERFVFFFVFLLIGISLLPSCKPETEEIEVDFGYDYFPLEVGKFIEYDVDSIIYDNVNNAIVVDSISFAMREEIVDTLIDNEGNLAYIVERFEKITTESPWVSKDIWVAQSVDNQGHRVEENLRFIKLTFPVSIETTPWDGNTFIDPNTTISVAGESIVIFKNWLYEYSEVDAFRVINNFQFDSTLTVVQANEENLIELRYSSETYAKGVGLVYKEMKILDTQCITPCTNDTWEEKAEKGFIVRQTVRDFN